jgi:hypothetical protein
MLYGDAAGVQAEIDAEARAQEAEAFVERAARRMVSTGGGYENAPATKLLATHCACCGIPLVDSVSVDVGVGPVCRKKHGFTKKVSEEVRREANQLVYQIALANSEGQGNAPRARRMDIARACTRLRELGFDKLAGIIEKRICPVRITVAGNALVVASPYSEEATDAFRRVPGRHWHGRGCSCGRDLGAEKVNAFPLASRPALWAALQRAFRGQVAIGPKGPFVIGQGDV